MKVGGVARTTDRDVYERLFPKLNRSQTTKLGVDAETTEVMRIWAEIKGLETTHPVRTSYESALTDAQSALDLAKSQANAAEMVSRHCEFRQPEALSPPFTTIQEFAGEFFHTDTSTLPRPQLSETASPVPLSPVEFAHDT